MTATNGTPKKSHVSLKELRERRRIAETRLELRRLRIQRRMLEAAWDDSWDPVGGNPQDFGGSDTFIRARTDGGYAYVPISVPSDRAHGRQWPIWRTEPELDRIRQQGRLLVAVNSFARGLVRNLTNYTIGKGFSYKVVAKGVEQGQSVPEGVKAMVGVVQDCVDDFLRRNRWNASADPRTLRAVAGTRERECYRRVVTEGEAFVRFYFEEDGRTIIRFLEPETVRNPPGHTEADGWSFGSEHQMQPFEDVETVLRYYRRYADPATANLNKEPKENADTVGEFIDAGDVLHLKGPDTPANVKRGISELCFDTARALERASKLQRNLSIGAGVRAATAEIWQAKGTTQQQMSAFAGAEQDGTYTDPATGGLTPLEKRYPGMIRRVPGQLEYVARPSENMTSEATAALAGDLRQGASSFAAPEYWLGDASNGNYSSLETASAPPVKNGETEQEYYRMAFCAVVWRAVLHAAEKGVLPSGALDVIDIQVEAPAVLHRNELEKAQADQIKVQGGWKSPQTCAMEDGLDPEIELANVEEFKERAGGMGLPLELPGEAELPGVPKELRKAEQAAAGVDPERQAAGETAAAREETTREAVKEAIEEAVEPTPDPDDDLTDAQILAEEKAACRR